jgi:hypothetical protein
MMPIAPLIREEILSPKRRYDGCLSVFIRLPFIGFPCLSHSHEAKCDTKYCKDQPYSCFHLFSSCYPHICGPIKDPSPCLGVLADFMQKPNHGCAEAQRASKPLPRGFIPPEPKPGSFYSLLNLHLVALLPHPNIIFCRAEEWRHCLCIYPIVL